MQLSKTQSIKIKPKVKRSMTDPFHKILILTAQKKANEY